MSQQLRIIAGAALLVVATGFASAGVFNALQPPLPQADGVTIGGQSPWQWLNWAVAGVGGWVGVVQFLKGLASQASPSIGSLLNSGEVGQFITQIPQVIKLVSGGNGSMVLDIDEKIGSVTVTGQLKVSRGTAPPAA